MGEIQNLVTWKTGMVVGYTESDKVKLFKSWKMGDNDEWNTACIIASTKHRFYRTILNGVIVYEGEGYQEKYPNKNLNIMGEKYGESENFTHSLFGRMSDINLWNRTFSQKEVSTWEECKMERGGNIVDWKTAEWTAVGLDETLIDKKVMRLWQLCGVTL